MYHCPDLWPPPTNYTMSTSMYESVDGNDNLDLDPSMDPLPLKKKLERTFSEGTEVSSMYK